MMNLSDVSRHVRFVLKARLAEMTLIGFDTEVVVPVTLQTVGLVEGPSAASEGTLVAFL